MVNFCRPFWALFAAAAVIFPVCATAQPHALDDLLKGLASNSVEARVEARQLLPRYGAQVAPRIVPLIGDEREVVWRAAFNVLSDIANQVSVPGREAERVVVTNAVMELLAPERSAHEKRQGLRIIPFVLPDAHPVAPIAALLQDGAVRERARAALEEARTLPACLALINALEDNDPDFQYAILSSLANFSYSIRITSQVTIASNVVPYAESASPKVRAGVARVLAASGDPRYAPMLKEIREAATFDTRVECADAILLLADAMVRKGGNFDAAMRLYHHVLETEQDTALMGAALSGLGRYGDDRAVNIILETLQGPKGGELEAPAMSALLMCVGRGRVEANALMAAYPDLTAQQQLVLLGGFGRSGDPIFLDILESAAQSGDSAFRTAAVNALAEMRHPAAVEGLADLALGGDEAQRAAARKSLAQLALAFVDSGDTGAAGRAYLGLYRTAQSGEEKDAALDGVKRHPVPEAYDLLVQEMGEAELDALPEGTLGPIAESLWKAGRRAEARETFGKIMGRLQTTAGVEQAVRLAGLMGEAEQLHDALGVVRHYYAIGPFPWSMEKGFDDPLPVDPAAIDLDGVHTVDGAEFRWKPLHTGELLGLVDLIGVYGEVHHASMFAYTEIRVSEAAAAQVRAGSDDGIKIWVNGEAVHENNVDRGSALDQEVSPCNLKAGRNTVLVQVTQNAGGWNFMLRLTKPDGSPLQFEELLPKQ